MVGDDSSVEVDNSRFESKIRNILNTIYYHLVKENDSEEEQQTGQMDFERLCGLKPGTVFAVVIDTTESMAVEISAVKDQVKQIVQSTKGTPDEPLEYLMVPFNDPFTGEGIIVETNAESFINQVDLLEADGGGDQREPMVEAMHADAIRCLPRSTIFLFTDAPATTDAGVNLLEQVSAMIISKRIEVNIYLTEPQLAMWDTVEHRHLAQISGGLIYKIKKGDDEAAERISQAAKFLQTSAEESKSFLYIGDDMTTAEATVTVDAAIREISVFSYAVNKNVESLSIANNVQVADIAAQGGELSFSENDGSRVVYKELDSTRIVYIEVIVYKL